ncbi:kinase-like domain-containing protein [Ilyonectria sp. MPI-CAGE-AT-0026]|nr:kinase-like domain-containing protein [Ilyonectria sp. MPI-CAGE-AT-0026]
MPSESEKDETIPERPPEAIWCERYEHIVQVMPHERLERYAPGGFHPVALGDTFCNGRYTVRHKLGHGGYSTVWLARDHQENRWVSIKIKQAYVSTCELAQDPEVKSLKLLEKRYQNSIATKSRCFPELLGYFRHTGPNGTHTCLVTELLGPAISTVQRVFEESHVYHSMTLTNFESANYDMDSILGAGDWTFQPHVVLRTSKQLLEALADTHQAGIAHGDITPNNVVFTCREVCHSDRDLWDALCKPRIAPYTGEEPRSAHFPQQLVGSTMWLGWYDNEWEDIRLIDWGDSYPVDETRSELSEPITLRSPETFFLDFFDYRHDLWRAGCVIYELFFQKHPFGSYICSDVDSIRHIIMKIGPLPSEWHARWEEVSNGDTQVDFRGDETWVRKPLVDIFEPRRNNIVSIFEKNVAYDDGEDDDHKRREDYEALRTLLHPMVGLMQHEPAKRISVQEAASYIQWTDRWREWPPNKEDSDGDGSDGYSFADKGSEGDGFEEEGEGLSDDGLGHLFELAL